MCNKEIMINYLLPMSHSQSPPAIDAEDKNLPWCKENALRSNFCFCVPAESDCVFNCCCF